MAHAEAYKDPGTPEEQTRRIFMANAVVALGGVIGISLAIPVLWSLVPAPEATGNQWSTLTPQEAATLDKTTQATPTRVTFDLHETNGYFGASDTAQDFWAVRTTESALRAARPELFANGPDHPAYPVLNMGFVVFSPICPHLGCRYDWVQGQDKFICPCHGSQYSELGKHEAGPALRGLDPLPLREYQGKVQVTWIEFQTNTPAMIIQKVG